MSHHVSSQVHVPNADDIGIGANLSALLTFWELDAIKNGDSWKFQISIFRFRF